MTREDFKDKIRDVQFKYWATPTINECIDDLVKVFESYFESPKNDMCARTLSGKHSFGRVRSDLAGDKLPYYPSDWETDEKDIRLCVYCGVVDNSD